MTVKRRGTFKRARNPVARYAKYNAKQIEAMRVEQNRAEAEVYITGALRQLQRQVGAGKVNRAMVKTALANVPTNAAKTA